MDLWNRARSFAEETAKRTQDLTREAAKRSQGLSFGASKFSEEIDQIIKHLADGVQVNPTQPSFGTQSHSEDKDLHLETFGITDELSEFVKGITITTFRDFPLQDDTELSDVPAVSNVRQDLTEWQEKHANLVLSTVKEISRFRYELCPRVMKERKFWRIYFILVNSHITLFPKYVKEPFSSLRYENTHKKRLKELLLSYENRYMEDAKLKSSEQVKDHKVMEPLKVGLTSNQEVQEVKKETKTSTSSTDQDLDVFLLGDMGDSDNDPDDGDGGFDDDLDKLVDSSDDENGKS